jgi:signal transduction histidine kinase
MSLAVSSANGVDLVVVGSVGQLQRALANLVDNAERHARSQVRIGTADRDGCAELWVDDDGPGIAPADRERVFERFTRLDDGRSRDQGGSGLGLAVVRSIVSRHHGRVWAEDSPLGGARLVISLPIAPSAVAARP